MMATPVTFATAISAPSADGATARHAAQHPQKMMRNGALWGAARIGASAARGAALIRAALGSDDARFRIMSIPVQRENFQCVDSMICSLLWGQAIARTTSRG